MISDVQRDESTTPKSWKDMTLNEVFTKKLHLWVASGLGAGATFTVVLAFSPWFRRWNRAITRRDVVRKVLVSSAIGGSIGYVLARQLQIFVEGIDCEPRHIMRDVRATLRVTKMPEFIASHPGVRDIVATEQSDFSDQSSSSQLNMSERIFTLCYQLFTTRLATHTMQNYLEQDLLASGVSRHDARIVITSLAHALDQDEWRPWFFGFMMVWAYETPKILWRTRPTSAFRGAPLVFRGLAAICDGLLFVPIVLTIYLVDVPAATYTNLIHDKNTVAAVLRAKFCKELDAQSSWK
ncbi:hypothetical protein DAEQUDRAFT_808171 [Daedalea quercina L-15889]|uniref:Uncharacterized protein n=1 Tax=Daedalea quercina L-15889 TaxID=1314783 RepID=A0A165TII2_9APHY|nr:hypothetical protein DAEQUDRAFT_808171 [Daedalea quercina L-15889]